MSLPVRDVPDVPDDLQPGGVPRTPVSCDGCDGRRAFIREAIGVAVGAAALSMLSSPLPLLALGSEDATVRYPIPAADGVAIDRKHEVMLCRSGMQLFAFALSCPHQNTALRALGGATGFQCPKHKSRYKPDGTFISGRATRNMDRLPIARDGDVVVVNVDVAYQSDRDAPRWAAAVVTL